MFFFVHLSSQQHIVLNFIIDEFNINTSHSQADQSITVKNGIIYDCEGNPCDGIQADYYDKEKSKVRITGKFSKGQPVSIIKGYHQNGQLKFRYYPYRQKYKFNGNEYRYCFYEEYDEAGNYTRYINDKIGIEQKYRRGGVVTSELHYNRKKSRVKYYADYFPGGKKKTIITKGDKYDYDEEGRLKCHWIRKSEKHHKKTAIMAASFYFFEYDTSENISRSGRFYTNVNKCDNWLHVAPEFPLSLDSVPLQDFKEIAYHKLGLKDLYRWDFANNKTIITRYKQQGDIWIEIERKSVPRVLQSN